MHTLTGIQKSIPKPKGRNLTISPQVHYVDETVSEKSDECLLYGDQEDPQFALHVMPVGSADSEPLPWLEPVDKAIDMGAAPDSDVERSANLAQSGRATGSSIRHAITPNRP